MAQSEYVKQRLENIARTQRAAEIASTRATEVYGKAMQTLEEVADVEKEQMQPDVAVTVSMSLSAAIEAFCSLHVFIAERENRIQNDLRRDRQVPSPLEREELRRLRVASDGLKDAIRAAEGKEVKHDP